MKTITAFLFVLIFSVASFGQIVTAVVTSRVGLVRDQPEAKAKVIRKLKKGAKFKFHESDLSDGFCYIILDKGAFRGWLDDKSFKVLTTPAEQQR